MLEQIIKEYGSIDKTWEVEHRKLTAVLEASERELKINIDSAEIKVLTESGTQDDFLYYVTEAKKEHNNNIIKALEKMKEAIVRFFSELKTRVMNIIRDKENQAKIDKLEKKIKLFPLAGKKKIAIENHEKEVKLIDRFLKQLGVLKAKVSAGGEVSKSEVADMKAEFFKEHGKVIAVGAAITITVAVAITMLKKMSDNVSSNIVYNEDKALEEAQWAIKHASDNFITQDAAQSIADFAAVLYKHRQQGEVRTIKNLIKSIKLSMSTFGKTVTSVTDAVSESVEDDSDLDFVFEGTDEAKASQLNAFKERMIKSLGKYDLDEKVKERFKNLLQNAKTDAELKVIAVQLKDANKDFLRKKDKSSTKTESVFDDDTLVYNFVFEGVDEVIDITKVADVDDEDPWENVIDDDKADDAASQIPETEPEESVDDLYARITMKTEETDMSSSAMDKPMDPKQSEQLKKDLAKDTGTKPDMPMKTEETDPDMEKINDAAKEDDSINTESTSTAEELINDMIYLFG